jgi:hypothetical protein
MRKLLIIAALAALFLVVLPIAPAGATPPSAVEFEVPTMFGGGPFTATGPAVSDGIVCSSGETFDLFAKGSGFQSDQGFNVQVVKQFVCDDGSGTFDVKLQVRIDRKGDNFNWTVVGGTGDYVKLHGSGKGIGIPIDDPPFEVLDLYEGKVHID